MFLSKAKELIFLSLVSGKSDIDKIIYGKESTGWGNKIPFTVLKWNSDTVLFGSDRWPDILCLFKKNIVIMSARLITIQLQNIQVCDLLSL